MSPAEIERDLELKHATVQMQLKRMIEKGLIEKRGRGKYRLVVLDETGDIDNLHEPGTTKIAFQKADHEAENPSIPPESTGTPIKRVQSMRLESSRQIVKKALRENSEKLSIGGDLSVFPFLAWLASGFQP